MVDIYTTQQCSHSQYMLPGLNEEFGVEFPLHERVEKLDQGRVHSLGPLGIPLLNQTTELILHNEQEYGIQSVKKQTHT